MSDHREFIPYERYRAEARALRAAAIDSMFRRLAARLARPRRRAYPPAGSAVGAQ